MNAKTEPQNCADLARMIETSSKWFDGTIEYEGHNHDDAKVGDLCEESVHVRVDVANGIVRVFAREMRVGEVLGHRHYSLTPKTIWENEYSFDEFRRSEWWEKALAAFENGDCDASRFGFDVQEYDDGATLAIEACIEEHYRDFFNNTRTGKGERKIAIYVDLDGKVELHDADGRWRSYDISEWLDAMEIREKLTSRGVEVSTSGLSVSWLDDGE